MRSSLSLDHDAHSIGRNDRHGGFGGNKFSFRDDVHDVIGEARFPAGPQCR